MRCYSQGKFLPELVAPAGNLEKLKTACLYGADSVYLGLQKHNLRIASENFTERELKEAIHFCRALGKKCYVLLNALFDYRGILELSEILRILSKLRPEALIISDLGCLNHVRKGTDLPLFLSTQSSCVNSETAAFWKDQGVVRIILGREVTIRDAARIKEKAEIEVEMFVHGAMCMGWSGHCLLSNFMKGRDANRGGCCQACRFRYDLRAQEREIDAFSFLSSKDLRGMSFMEDFIRYGIDALKIEGRMKSTLYVATIVKAYKEALRNASKGRSPSLEEMDSIKHRDYTEGFLNDPFNPDTLYDEKREKEKYKMVGSVLEASGSGMYVHVKNPFSREDHLELLPFEGPSIPLTLQKIRDMEGISLTLTRPNTVVFMEVSQGAKKFNLLRLRQ